MTADLLQPECRYQLKTFLTGNAAIKRIVFRNVLLYEDSLEVLKGFPNDQISAMVFCANGIDDKSLEKLV